MRFVACFLTYRIEESEAYVKRLYNFKRNVASLQSIAHKKSDTFGEEEKSQLKKVIILSRTSISSVTSLILNQFSRNSSGTY